MNQGQKSILADLAEGDTVQYISKSDADALASSGHVRRVTVQNPPKDAKHKVAVSITALGRGALLPAKAHEPVDEAPEAA